METIAVLLLIGVAVYFLFRHNTERGANAVRAFLYHQAIHAGASADVANQLAQVDVVNGSPQTVREAKEYARIAYGGKQLPMIEEAEKLGFLSNRYARAIADVRAQEQMSERATYAVNRTDRDIDFDTYKAMFVSEVKRLSGKTDADLHWVELTDDDGTRRAFNDGIDPKALALAVHYDAKPSS